MRLVLVTLVLAGALACGGSSEPDAPNAVVVLTSIARRAEAVAARHHDGALLEVEGEDLLGVAVDHPFAAQQVDRRPVAVTDVDLTLVDVPVDLERPQVTIVHADDAGSRPGAVCQPMQAAA